MTDDTEKRTEVADQLRKLADDVESGEVEAVAYQYGHSPESVEVGWFTPSCAHDFYLAALQAGALKMLIERGIMDLADELEPHDES